MLADFLFGQLRTRVMAILLLNPDSSWHVRGLARELKVLPGSVNRELVKLTEVGILLRENVGNQARYRANRECPVFVELAGLLRKTAGVATVLAKALGPISDQLECALVFGSVARGEETVYSDVDVLVLGNVGFALVVEVLHPVQNELQREINPVVYRVDDFRAKLASNNTWAREVVDKPKLFLIGNADDFAELVGYSKPHGVQCTA